MEEFIYIQLNQDNICVSIANLKSDVPEMNYNTEVDFDPIIGQSTEKQVFVSRMIKVPVYSSNYLGLHYIEDGKWEEAKTQV